MANVVVTSVFTASSSAPARARGPRTTPRHIPVPVRKPKSGPAGLVVSLPNTTQSARPNERARGLSPQSGGPIIGGELGSRRPEGLRLTQRGLAVVAVVLLAQFCIAVCLIVVNFFAVSNDPLPAVPAASGYVAGEQSSE